MQFFREESWKFACFAGMKILTFWPTNSLSSYMKTLQQMIPTDEEASLINGLGQVREELSNGTFVLEPGDEDIHTANERRLTELIGPVGGKLHTGRSRNDQVATDTRLWTVEAERQILTELALLLHTGAEFAREHVDVLMAGYTHLQPAQPIRFSHWMMSHVVAFMRDAERLTELIPRANKCPLGCGALAGNAFGVDREFLARELGFDGVTPNSLDGVSDRDFVVEFLLWASMFLMHLSQMAEDLIITNMLKGVIIDDAYATGSSLMPQKKNPDGKENNTNDSYYDKHFSISFTFSSLNLLLYVKIFIQGLELLRGKAGIMMGKAVGVLATLKGLPRAYNKDLQEDKVPLFEAVDTVKDCIAIATGIIATMKPKPENLMKALCPEMLATDLADYLVRKGVPFRETHHISGACVRLAEETDTSIDALTLEQLQKIDPRFEQDVMKVWDYEVSVERKKSIGGTAKTSVLRQIEECISFANSLQDVFN